MILVINALKPDFTPEVLKKVGSALQDALNAGSWRDAKLLLRLLGCLQGLFEGDGIFVILEDLFNRAVDLQTASSDDVSSIFTHPLFLPPLSLTCRLLNADGMALVSRP